MIQLTLNGLPTIGQRSSACWRASCVHAVRGHCGLLRDGNPARCSSYDREVSYDPVL